MGVRIRLLLLYWLDEEGKSKENKIKKMCRSPQIFWLPPPRPNLSSSMINWAQFEGSDCGII
jgi:hypothetical protein